MGYGELYLKSLKGFGEGSEGTLTFTSPGLALSSPLESYRQGISQAPLHPSINYFW